MADTEMLPEKTFGAWVLRASSDDVDIDAMLERFGQIYRCPISPSERADQMGPGQPVFLVRTDRSRVVGVWAVGEVVAPVLVLGADSERLPGEAQIPATGRAGADARTYAEVELLPLAKAISLDKLRADPGLAASELVSTPDLLDPLVLTPHEVRAIEAMEFWIETPSEEQRAALDAAARGRGRPARRHRRGLSPADAPRRDCAQPARVSNAGRWIWSRTRSRSGVRATSSATNASRSASVGVFPRTWMKTTAAWVLLTCLVLYSLDSEKLIIT